MTHRVIDVKAIAPLAFDVDGGDRLVILSELTELTSRGQRGLSAGIAFHERSHLFRMVRTAGQRRGHHLQKAHCFARYTPCIKLRWSHESFHLQMLRRRLQILTNGQNIAVYRPQVCHGRPHFLIGFP